MSNKIEGPRLAPLPPPSAADAADRKSRASSDGKVNATAGTDSVRLTDVGSELSAAAARAGGAPAPFDAARVAAVRAALADGSFKVDAQLIADRLLSTEKDLPR